MKNIRKLWPIILLILCILIVLITSYFIYRQQFQETDSSQANCKNLCGDGFCQEIVCFAIGCPCPESHLTCPQDCPWKPERNNQPIENERLLIDEERIIDDLLNEDIIE